METTKNKIKLLEIAQQLKKDNISYDEAKEKILTLDKKDSMCCDNIVIEETRCKYPNGLPIESIDITYCSSCGIVHNVTW